MLNPKFAGKLTGEIEKMPEKPNRVAHHRRAHSETFYPLPDNNLLLDDFDIFNLDIPSLTIDSDSSYGPDNISKRSRPLGPTHSRSLSVDADLFDGDTPAMSQQHRRNSYSMDGCDPTAFEYEKKVVGPDELAQLSLIDPKKAKRILANRQSAARSKERKVRYTSELERKVQTLQSEATTLSAQVTMMQRDMTGMTIGNKQLKLRLQALEQQAHLRDALNETLREEVNRLKIETGQVPPVNGNSYNQALPPHFSSHPQSYNNFGNHQGQLAQQQLPHQQQQIHMSQSTSDYHQARSRQPQPSFPNYN